MPETPEPDDLLAEASRLPPDQWRPFLLDRTGDRGATDRLLRQLFELSSEQRTMSSAERTTRSSAEGGPEPAIAQPRRIGPYEILEPLGQGGFGTVYLARQTEPVEREVAVKVVRAGRLGAEMLAQFQDERQALAMMSHDGIAKVFDCGTTESGDPYFAMERVKGTPLTEFCARTKLPLARRIDLIQQLCAAVQHAHQKGLVHRDLKPGNALVTDESGEPRVKVIDFGIAVSTGPSLLRNRRLGLGTLAYMAPEQAALLDVDTRADVYAIGVMLYEVLVGSLPLQPSDGDRAEMLRLLSDVDPPPPTRRLASSRAAAEIAAARGMSLRELRAALATDLDWITQKALKKDRNQRYATPAALADDLQRYLDGRPVDAAPQTSRYLLAKALRRHRRQAIAVGAVLATALVGAVVAVVLGLGWRSSAERLARKVRDYDLLASVPRRDRALADAERLYPAEPRNVAALRSWLDGDVRAVLGMQDEIDTALAEPPAPDDPGQVFLHEQLRELRTTFDRVRDVEADVARRLRWATQVAALTNGHPNAQFTWDDVRADLAAAGRSDPYRGCKAVLDERAVLGLVPIGRNPKTKLWECYDLRSAWDGACDPATLEIPKLGEDGSVPVRPELGIVFVLLPGGPFFMEEPDGDGGKLRSEMTLAPFFIARHELTRGQWQRLATRWTFWWKPEDFTAGAPLDDAHPAEKIAWADADRWLTRHGLSLPTEAQWEYACRARRKTLWSCEPERLREVANLLDGSVRGEFRWGKREPWDDGHPFIARVGSFEANDFGLYDVHGNVAEWCRDWFVGLDLPVRDGDGYREKGSDPDPVRLHRGGSYRSGALEACCGYRSAANPDDAGAFLGVRAVRNLDR